MDFSLDGAFGKTSFKLDMPDIAFSISPKKSSKSKENNSEGESTEGSRQEKNGKFDFSFDFNGEGNGQTLHDNPSSHGKELMKHDSAVEEKEKNADVSRDGDGNKNGETGTMVVGSLPSDGQKVKDEPHLLDNRKMSVDIKPSRSKEIAFIEVFGKIPSLKLDKPNSDPCCYSKKPSKFNKKLAVEGLDKGTCQEKIDKLSSPLRLTVKLDAAPISEEDKVVGVVETLGKDNFTLATAASSAANIFKSMNSEVASNTEIQRSGFEDSPAPADSKPTHANPISVQNQVSGANNFSMVRGTNDGAGMKLTIAESKKTGSTPVGASDLGDDTSYERDVEEFDDSSSSCAKEILKQDSAVEKRGKMLIYPGMSIIMQMKKSGLIWLFNLCHMMQKQRSIRLPSLVPSKRISKSSNQGYEKLKEKISSTSTVQNSSLCQDDRLPFAKIMPSLPSLRMPSLSSLKITRNTIPYKQSSSLALKEQNVMENLEKNSRRQVKSKMVSPVNVQKQTPSMPSLKRKPSEAADIHPSKRLSSIDSRKSEVLAREAVNNVTSSTCSEVPPQGTMLEESQKNATAENLGQEFDFRLETNMENLGFTLMESDGNVEKAEACAKELDEICTMLKKKHEEAKELLVRALVNNNNLLMLNHPICEEKIHKVQRFASRLMPRAQEAGV